MTDLDLSYGWNKLTFGVGVQNLFDSFPDVNRLGTPQANLGIFKYPRNSPAGMNGRFVYTRVGYRF